MRDKIVGLRAKTKTVETKKCGVFLVISVVMVLQAAFSFVLLFNKMLTRFVPFSKGMHCMYSLYRTSCRQ